VSRRSPFRVVLAAEERRVLEARVRRPSSGRCCGRRSCLQPRRVRRTSRSPSAWASRRTPRPSGASASSRRAWQGWLTGTGRAGRGPFPLAVIAEVKAIAGELPALRAVPLSRFSIADVRQEAIACGLVEQLSVSTVWRWLDEDALKPWRHRSWIFPRARTSPPRRGSCSTCTSAGLRASGWGQTSSSSRPTRSLDPGPLPPPPDPAASLRHGHAGRARVRARRRAGLPGGLGCAPRPVVRPLRGHHRHRAVRVAWSSR
jgi:hypothetical protein